MGGSGGGGVWVVLSSIGVGWVCVTVVIIVVYVWQDILVPVHHIINETFESADILGVNIFLVSITVVDGGVVVLGVEELDKGINVLVEKNGVDEILLEGLYLPKALEVDGSNITLKAWILNVLTEQGEGHVFTEEGVAVELIDGIHTVNIIIDALESLSVGLLLDGIGFLDNISKNVSLLQGKFVCELLLQ